MPILKKELIENKHKLMDVYTKEVGYTFGDVNLLFEDLIKFITGFEKLWSKMLKVWFSEESFYNDWENAKLSRAPWGKVLICSPYNSVIPLIPIFIISFCSMGNEVILVPSRKSMNTTILLFDILKKVFATLDWDFRLILKEEGYSLWKIIESQNVNLLYYQGSSKSRSDIYNNCINLGVDLIYEGEGNQVTIIEDPIDSDLHDLVNILVTSKKFCNGQLCTTPNIIFIQSSKINAFLQSNESVARENIVYNLMDEKVRKLLNLAPCTNELFLVEYDNFDILLQFLRINYKYGLQVTLFSQRPEPLQNKILKVIQTSRLVINKDPTYQNSLLPWGGYRYSGLSRVQNFLEKGVKTVVIES